MIRTPITLLKRERLLQGMYQDELSQLTGINRAYLSWIENGRLNPNDHEKETLAKALKVPVERIFPKDKK